MTKSIGHDLATLETSFSLKKREGRIWCSMPMADASEIVSSLSSNSPQPQVEWLMLPSYEKVDGTHSRCSVASSTSQRKSFTWSRTCSRGYLMLGAWACLTGGWCFWMKKQTNINLFNPFSNARIDLPAFISEFKLGVPKG